MNWKWLWTEAAIREAASDSREGGEKVALIFMELCLTVLTVILNFWTALLKKDLHV